MIDDVILKIENVSKQYRLGTVGTGTISHDLNRFFAKIRGKEDPFLKIGEANDRASTADSDYVWALKDINFEVKRGEVLGIIGRNGAGKSTLLKILSKVTGPTTGTIKSKGRIASLLEVGTGFHPEMTGRENIFLNGAILGMTKKEIANKLNEIVEFSGCERYIETPVKRYSSGMKVRLAFAVAAFLEPDILVVDEVLAVGDAEFQKKAIGKMQDISNTNGRTVLFVSHNMGAVKSLCKTGIVIDKGCIVFKGKSHDAIQHYQTLSKTIESVAVNERKDRLGNGKIRVSEVSFLNNKDEIIGEIVSGDPLKVKIKIDKHSAIEYNQLVVVVNFMDDFDNFVVSFISDEMGSDFNYLENKNEITLFIPKLLLRSSEYKLRILLSEGTPSKGSFLDSIENVARINVLEGDLWGVGQLNRKGSYGLLPGEFKETVK